MPNELSSTQQLEARAGVESLAVLHAMRDRLIAQSARMEAIYGPFGMWDALRKSQLGFSDLRVRDATMASGERTTEAKLSAEAHTHPEYTAWLSRSVEEKATWIALDNQITTVNDRIRSRENEMHHVRTEMGLAR